MKKRAFSAFSLLLACLCAFSALPSLALEDPFAGWRDDPWIRQNVAYIEKTENGYIIGMPDAPDTPGGSITGKLAAMASPLTVTFTEARYSYAELEEVYRQVRVCIFRYCFREGQRLWDSRLDEKNNIIVVYLPEDQDLPISPYDETYISLFRTTYNEYSGKILFIPEYWTQEEEQEMLASLQAEYDKEMDYHWQIVLIVAAGLAASYVLSLMASKRFKSRQRRIDKKALRIRDEIEYGKRPCRR